jgi:hypothetical protein
MKHNLLLMVMMGSSVNPTYVPVTVEFEDDTWTNVGLRFKGNSSLRSTCWLSFRYCERILPHRVTWWLSTHPTALADRPGEAPAPPSLPPSTAADRRWTA